MSACYNNFLHDPREKNLPKCPTCRESLIKDCESTFIEDVDEDWEPYYFMIPFAIAPTAPPPPSAAAGAGAETDEKNFNLGHPVQGNMLDLGQFEMIAFSYDKWEDIPLTKSEGGLLPASCQCCDPEIYDRALENYQSMQTAQIGRLGAVVTDRGSGRTYITKGAPRQRPALTLRDRPTHNIWKLGYCVVAMVPDHDEDSRENWTQQRVRVGGRMMYQTKLRNGTPVEIPLEPRCLGPPRLGPPRCGRHPIQGGLRVPS